MNKIFLYALLLLTSLAYSQTSFSFETIFNSKNGNYNKEENLHFYLDSKAGDLRVQDIKTKMVYNIKCTYIKTSKDNFDAIYTDYYRLNTDVNRFIQITYVDKSYKVLVLEFVDNKNKEKQVHFTQYGAEMIEKYKPN
ncbi:hypothetical protein [Flavobacterium columnare]|uniref:DUF3108 domain-containing protein n=1 Tax=Flavobacterium columnare TaxID=996 RepID=A0AAI8CIV2_9FLAO|nr:hypothetical protein [Flavobacterium columnare]AMO20726.1 hypothetical protein UN65_10605 [Flavobacterium columnare]AUX18707.1 hypothetical protein AQ623_10765 [Flavobacterium columnare]QOG57789.1 hypothetical protein HUE29_10670 [Flavobacterium columnare]QOG60513.1 hypothetical protein HUE30_10670 [Flavobacterium columnare]QOG63233.1 hypothetical protein HUE31_10670 [Flavobacterium columnare]